MADSLMTITDQSWLIQVTEDKLILSVAEPAILDRSTIGRLISALYLGQGLLPSLPMPAPFGNPDSDEGPQPW